MRTANSGATKDGDTCLLIFTKLNQNAESIHNHVMLTCFSVIMLLYERREVSVNICLFEALRYKQEGRASDSRWSSEFFIKLIFAGDSASNRNQSNRKDY